jgi:trehalose 6-phosphate synthase
MLGADLLGFHIQFHCNNFLETVDRALESRIDWAQFSVSRDGHRSVVKPFPISVAVPDEKTRGASPAKETEKEQLFKEWGGGAERLGIGVDRIDYTKGILERFRAIERFFEKYPNYLGRFSFVEVGAPSRSLIPTYHSLDEQIDAESVRINARFRSTDWRPIILLKKHHSHKEIARFYRVADVCMVTSLHDGMNLVAKEFIAAKDDLDGALILSRFTGAAQEFRDALIVNPYDIEGMADALFKALEMDAADRRKRMARMQAIIQRNNVYRWGADLITQLAEIRLDIRPPATRVP